jgi:FtsZ-binding cell division protein ZapB
MKDYSELKAAALAATPGAWVARADGWTIRAYPDARLAGDGIKVVHTCSPHMQGQGTVPDVEQQVANQHYIELAQPSAVLDLIAEIDRMSKGEAYLKDNLQAAYEDRIELRAERDRLKAENEELRKELADWQEIVSAIKRETPDKFTMFSRGNAPGHCHSIPGVWDSDNGAKAGKECAWCRVWNAAMSKEAQS